MAGNLNYVTHFRHNFHIAYPIVLSHLGHITVGIVDSMMVGRLGAEPLAAASLAMNLFVVILMFAIGVSYAITPLVAAADGKDDHEQSLAFFTHGLLINILTGGILLLLIGAGIYGLYYFDQPVGVVDLAIPYMHLILLSLVPFMVFQTFKQYAEGLAFTQWAMYITIGSNGLNILLNYMLIFGHWGFPALGLNGAGWATLLSRFIMAFLMAMYVIRSPWFAQQALKLKGFQKTITKRLLHVGVPIGLQYVFETGTFAFSAIMMGWIGAAALASHQITMGLAGVSYMMAAGVAAAATVRVGNFYGQKNWIEVRMAAFSGFILMISIMVPAAIIFVFGNNWLPTLFIQDVEVISLASNLLLVAAVFQLADGIQVVGLGALRGLSDVKIPTWITLIAYWVIGLPVAYLLGFKWELGAEGIWYGISTGLFTAAILLFLRFNLITLKAKAKKAKTSLFY